MKSVGMNPSEQELLDMINEGREIFRGREGGIVISTLIRIKTSGKRNAKTI